MEPTKNVVNERAFSDLDQIEAKRFSTLQAEYALAGHALMRNEAGDQQSSYLATRWGHAKPLRDLEEAAEFLARLRAPTT